MKVIGMKRAVMVALVGLVALAGCHNAKKENVQPPTPLSKDFKPTVQVTRLWRESIGDGAKDTGVRLRPTVVDGVLYADSADGKLVALDANTGKTIWSKSSRTHGWFGWGDKKRKDAFYAGGPAVSGDLLAVGTLDGHVYGVNAKDGSPRWEATLESEVLASPVVVGNLVVVRTGDGRVYGLDTATGERRWVYDQSEVPVLSLRGNGPLMVANGVVFFGSDGGKLVALRLDNGEKLWEQNLASGEGRTEIERLDDADGLDSARWPHALRRRLPRQPRVHRRPERPPDLGASVLHLHLVGDQGQRALRDGRGLAGVGVRQELRR